MTRSQPSYLKLVAAGAVALALAVGLLLFLAPGESTDPTLSAQPEVIGAGALDDNGAASVEREAATSGSATSAGGRDRALGKAALDEDPTAVLIRLVKASTGEPCANAALRVWSSELTVEQAWLVFSRALKDSELELLLARDTQSVTVDAHGHARLPKSTSTRWAIAQSGSDWGYARLDPDNPRPVELTLHPDFALDVRVVDTAGRPVPNMTVSVRMIDPSDDFEELHRARTNADGLARIEHVGWCCEKQRIESHRPLRVTLATPLPEPVDFEFEVQSPPRERVELVLPEGGALEVRLVDAMGAPQSLEFQVELTPILRRSSEPNDFGTDGVPATVRGSEGVAVFRSVPVGREFLASVEVLGASHPRVVTGLGPTALGATAVLEVECRSRSVLRGRALDGEGRTANGRRLVVVASNNEDDVRELGRATTDAEGRFEVAGFALEVMDWLEFGERDPVGGPKAFGRLKLAGTPLAQAFATGAVDVGDVQLLELPLLASGRVVDDSGLPVVAASISARVRGDPVDSLGLPLDGWEFLWNARTRTDGHGRFELRGTPKGRSISIYGRSSEGWSRTEPLPLGSSGIELVLSRAGSVAGRIVAAPPLDPRALRVELRLREPRETGAPPNEGHFDSTVASDGRFALRFLPPGTYDARVVSFSDGGTLATVERVVVRAGERTLDPRLDPVEVRRNGIVLRVVDERGRRLVGATAEIRTRDARPGDHQFLHTNLGTLFLPESELPVDLWIGSDGYVTEFLPGVTQSRRVELRRATRLQVSFAVSGPLPDAAWDLWFLSSEPSGSTLNWIGLVVDPHSPVEFAVPFEGRVGLRLDAIVPDVDSPIEVEVEPASVQIDARVPVQTLKVQIDADRVRTAIEAARRGDAPEGGDGDGNEGEPDGDGR